MTFLKLEDNDYSWVAIQHPNKAPELVLSTYADDAPAWDIIPVLDRTIRLATKSKRKRDLLVYYYDVYPLLDVFRQLLDHPLDPEARLKMKEFGVQKWDFDTETDFIAHLLKTNSTVLQQFLTS